MNNQKNPSPPVTRHQPVTRETYYAALDALTLAQRLEAEKIAAGPEALAAWWPAAEPRWRELHAVLERAEAEDWVRSAVWFDLWRDARRAGKAPGSIDTRQPAPSTSEAARSQRVAATSPATRPISVAGSI